LLIDHVLREPLRFTEQTISDWTPLHLTASQHGSMKYDTWFSDPYLHVELETCDGKITQLICYWVSAVLQCFTSCSHTFPLSPEYELVIFAHHKCLVSEPKVS